MQLLQQHDLTLLRTPFPPFPRTQHSWVVLLVLSWVACMVPVKLYRVEPRKRDPTRC